jgi:hypothetical protein
MLRLNQHARIDDLSFWNRAVSFQERPDCIIIDQHEAMLAVELYGPGRGFPCPNQKWLVCLADQLIEKLGANT